MSITPLPTDQLIEQLYERGGHLGYSRSRRHPSTVPYLYGMKNRIDLIDLESTADAITAARLFLATLRATGKKIILIGAKPEVRETIAAIANENDLPFVNKRWIGGTLTNFSEIKKRLAKLADLTGRRDTNNLVYRTKRERLTIERTIEDLNEKFGGLVGLEGMPAAAIVIDPKAEHIAVSECIQKRIPIIAIANTDCDVDIIKYPIPTNDANVAVIHFILNQLFATTTKTIEAVE